MASVSPRKLNKSKIFLTGATGVLGGHLMKELLRSTQAEIYCLVRAENEDLGKNRLLTFLKSYDPELTLLGEFQQRIIPILGNIVGDHMGLPMKEYRELAEKIDLTVHAAALTNLFLNYRRIEPINVGGTRNAVTFALHTPQKNFCYVSTHTVMGDKTFDKSVAYKETDFDIGQNFENMNYQKSKFVAEKLVRDATEHGLLWNIMRPGQIFGEGHTGFYPQGYSNVSGLFYDIFKTVIDTEVALFSKSHFDVVPVDYVSRGILDLCFNSDSFGQTYHFTNPDVKMYFEVIDLIREQGYKISVIDQSEYKKMLFENRIQAKGSEYKSSTISAFRWWYKRETFDFSEGAITDCQFTDKLMESSGIRCPKVDSNLIGTYLAEGVRQKYFPKESQTIRRISV